ncbi:MAG: oligosaccharide flippase family protein [Chitinophagaceae bacterium]
MGPNLKQTVLSVTKNADYQRIAKNFFSLGIIQVTNYLVPLILLPYLVRTLGLAQYGVIVFTQVIIGYFESVMQYSFSLTAVNEVSQNVKSKEAISEIIKRVMGAKLLLAAISVSLIIIMAFIVPRFDGIKTLLLWGTLYCAGSILNFDWFFQGIQEMKNLTFINIITRIFSLIWVFCTVKSSENVLQAFLTVPLGYLITGIVSLFLLTWKYKIKIGFSGLQAAVNEIRKGFHIFYSQLMVRFYSADINITILGFIADNSTVGMYALAHRIFSLLIVMSGLITTTLFPYLSLLFKQNYEAYKTKTRQLFGFSALAFGFLSALVFIFSGKIISFINGKPNDVSTSCLQLLCLALFVSPFPPLINQVLIFHGRSKWLPAITTIAVLVNLSFFVPLYSAFQVKGLAITNIVVFCVLTFAGFWVIKKEQLFSLHKNQYNSIEQ